MTIPSEPPALHQPGVRQPCTEACAAFRQLTPNRWSEFGLCANARSPRRGYPVRIGRECKDFQVAGKVERPSDNQGKPVADPFR